MKLGTNIHRIKLLQKAQIIVETLLALIMLVVFFAGAMMILRNAQQ